MGGILVSVPGCIGFGGVIALATAAGRCISGEDGCADLEMKNDVAFEANRITKISARRKVNGTPASSRRGANCFIDSRSINGAAITGGTKHSDVKNAVRIQAR